ncbi:MAG: hypothetical protein WCK63_01980 [Betaproteobacteria bacterium]
MVNAIGLSNYSGYVRTGDSQTSLDVRLAQYESQLADWKSCPSCKTPEGKAKITELTSKISEIKQRQNAAEVVNQSAGPGSALGHAPTAESRNSESTLAPRPLPQDHSIGSRLDDYA